MKKVEKKGRRASILENQNGRSSIHRYHITVSILKMGRRADLSSEEQTAILTRSKEGVPMHTIAKQVNRPLSAVSTVVKRSSVTVASKRRDGLKKISTLPPRLLLHRAHTSRYTARQLRDTYVPNVTVRRVEQLLSSAPNLRWARMQRAPNLTNDHKTLRLSWAEEHLARGAAFWKQNIFSDDKRWTLDGPDGLASYWKDEGRSPRWFHHLQRGGGGIMVWAVLCVHGKLELEFVSGGLNVSVYVDILERRLLLFLEEYMVKNAIFQQDNAPAHTYNVVKN